MTNTPAQEQQATNLPWSSSQVSCCSSSGLCSALVVVDKRNYRLWYCMQNIACGRWLTMMKSSNVTHLDGATAYTSWLVAFVGLLHTSLPVDSVSMRNVSVSSSAVAS